jgi:hypothetical protein
MAPGRRKEGAASADSGPGRIKRSGLQFGTWGINANFENGTFELYRVRRSELAHLTVLTKTTSGQIDCHLTFGHEAAMRGDGEKTHEPLFQVGPGDFAQLGRDANQAMEQVFRAHIHRYRRFRPGWLRKRGYLVSVLERDAVQAWLKRSTPQKRRKFRVDPAVVFSAAHVPPEFVEELYDPAVLHALRSANVRAGVKEDSEVVVYAFRRIGDVKQRHGVLLSNTIGPNRRWGWWGIPNRDIFAVTRSIHMKLFDWLAPRIRAEHAERFEKIVVGLGLEEDEGGRRLAERVRSFLSNPRNPIRKPDPGMTVR